MQYDLASGVWGGGGGGGKRGGAGESTPWPHLSIYKANDQEQIQSNSSCPISGHFLPPFPPPAPAPPPKGGAGAGGRGAAELAKAPPAPI